MRTRLMLKCLTPMLFLLGTLCTASAQITGPIYPPPGNVTFSGAGNSGQAGGRTNSYSAFSPAGYTDLYWGLDSTTFVGLSLNADPTGAGSVYSGAEIMTFTPTQSSLPNGILVWTGSSPMLFLSGSNFVQSTLGTRFTVRITKSDGTTPLALTSPGTVGLSSALGGVIHVTGDFKANLLFEAQDPFSGAYTPALTMFNAYNHSGDPRWESYNSTFSGGFYYTPLVTVSGVVQLPGLAPSAVGQNVRFQFRPFDNSGVFTRTATITASGAFSLSGIPEKSYAVWIKGDKYLAQVVPVNTTGGSVNNVMATLPGGDANNDNVCDIVDFGILVNVYGNSYNTATVMLPDPNVEADFNGDGVVDIVDFGILVNNYGAVGAP